MNDEQQVRPGFLPPRAPGSGQPSTLGGPETPRWQPPAPIPPSERPTFVTAGREPGPSSPLAVMAIVLAAISMGLLVISVGVGYTLSAIMAGIALAMAFRVRHRIAAGAPGRPGQARAAVVVASIALALAAVAAVVWIVLESSGITPDDLQRWLEDELERQRNRQDSPGEPA